MGFILLLSGYEMLLSAIKEAHSPLQLSSAGMLSLALTDTQD